MAYSEEHRKLWKARYSTAFPSTSADRRTRGTWGIVIGAGIGVVSSFFRASAQSWPAFGIRIAFFALIVGGLAASLGDALWRNLIWWLCFIGVAAYFLGVG